MGLLLLGIIERMRREVTAHATGRAGLGSPGLHLLGLKDHTHTRAGNEVEAQRHNASKHVALFHFFSSVFQVSPIPPL